MSLIRELMNSAAYKKIEQDVSVFTKEKLSGYNPQRIESKTIHDSIWGSVDYSAWEMQIIDSPLFQRLRDLSQTGLAMFTYPTARHSRFEHSLGVATVAKKICARIPLNCDENIPGASQNCITFAALLHDIGHCFYSHLSETIKWRGYVFVSDKIDRTIAYKVAEKFVLKGKAKLKNPTAYIKGLQI